MAAKEEEKKAVVEKEKDEEKGTVAAAAPVKEVVVGNTIILTSSDGKPFEISLVGTRLSKFLAEMIKGGGAVNGVSLTIISSAALEMVVEYCSKHADADADADFDPASGDLEKWDREFVDGLSQDSLIDLIVAADFLDVEDLLDATCHRVAGMMNGNTLDQIRKMFNINNDFTEDEEDEWCGEDAWAFLDEELSDKESSEIAVERARAMAAEGEKVEMEAEKGEKGTMEAEMGAKVEEKGATGAEEAAGGETITLRCSDGELRSVSKAVVTPSSALIRKELEVGRTDIAITLPNVAVRTLDTVLEYCNKRAQTAAKPDSDPDISAGAEAAKPDYDLGAAAETKPGSYPTTAATGSSSSSVSTAASEDLEDWDRAFLDDLPVDALYDLLGAANDLEMDALIHTICEKFDDMMKDKTLEEIRATFDISNDFTPAEEAELLLEYS